MRRWLAPWQPSNGANVVEPSNIGVILPLGGFEVAAVGDVTVRAKPDKKLALRITFENKTKY